MIVFDTKEQHMKIDIRKFSNRTLFFIRREWERRERERQSSKRDEEEKYAERSHRREKETE